MSDEQSSGDGVGSVGEEAAKLLSALQDWAQEGGQGAGGLAGDLAGDLGEQLRSVDERVATGGQDCTYCPVCQVIARVRGASPEVRTHLAVATSSLLQAAATLLEARAPRSPSSQDGQSTGRPAAEPHVTKIDLDDEPGPDEG